MRQEGVGYTKIARILEISENTVKSYCKRNKLGGRAAIPIDNTDLFCKNCGASLEQTPGGKTRKFCSDKCRVAWWNAHPEFVKKKAVYNLKCAHCGMTFESYGNKARKYCSHACYISGRFGAQDTGDRA